MKKKVELIQSEFKSDRNGYFINEKLPILRYKMVEDVDPYSGVRYWDFRFEIFKRPYFFGLLGRKKWEMSVQTNGFIEGVSFSQYLLGLK